MTDPVITFRGEKDLMKNLLRIARKEEGRIGPALFRRANAILADSKQNYVPVDLGPLRASGTVEEPRGLGEKTSVSIVFGGPATPYALAVHETPSSHDPVSWKAAGKVNFVSGGSKYLEKPLLAASSTLLRDLAEDLDVERR